MAIETYKLEGLHCAACVGRITSALKPYAEAVAVTLDPPRAVLTNPTTDATLEALRSAAASVGRYTLLPVTEPSPAAVAGVEDNASWLGIYWPLVVIVGYIAVVAFAGAPRPGETVSETWMLNFMAGFFLVFSAFKFLNLSGFADAYATYDLLAKRWPTYGFIYPFIELALGLAYLFRFQPDLTNIVTVILMSFSSLGVLAALRSRRQIACACLGTVLKLPMSTITLVEDIGMAAMAAVMLLA